MDGLSTRIYEIWKEYQVSMSQIPSHLRLHMGQGNLRTHQSDSAREKMEIEITLVEQCVRNRYCGIHVKQVQWVIHTRFKKFAG